MTTTNKFVHQPLKKAWEALNTPVSPGLLKRHHEDIEAGLFFAHYRILELEDENEVLRTENGHLQGHIEAKGKLNHPAPAGVEGE